MTPKHVAWGHQEQGQQALDPPTAPSSPHQPAHHVTRPEWAHVEFPSRAPWKHSRTPQPSSLGQSQPACRILLQLESEITELILAIFQVKWVSVGLCQWKMHSKISNNRHIKRPLFGKMAFRDLIIYNIFQVHISFSLASFLPTFPKENFQVYRKVERTVQQTLMSPPPRLYSLHSTVFTLSCCLSISLSV